MSRSDTSRDALLALLDEAFDRKAWHGPNLTGALRGVDVRLAAWRPAPGRNTIWELTLHCAYWKNVVLARISGERRELPWPGANFPEVPAAADAREWTRTRSALRDAHRALRAAVERLSDAEIASPRPGQARARLEHIRGAALHDVYHAGQISLIARMAKSRKR